MTLPAAHALVAALSVYALIGVAFALYFVVAGAQRIDPDATGMPWRARLVILPGAAGLWPLLVFKLLSAGRPT